MYVYFIQIDEDGPIKIGRTSDVEKRMTSLQTAHHRRLRVVHLETPGKGQSLKLEKQFHADFSDHRIRGEWFRPGLAILEYIGKAPLTWEKISAMDDDLKFLYQDGLVAECNDEDFEYSCPTDHHWYRVFKPQLLQIVGFLRKHDPVELQGTEAYEIAYHKICEAIPCPTKCKKPCKKQR